MKHYPKQDIRKACEDASSYREFKQNLKDMWHKVPQNVVKFPFQMKGWGRKLRYEKSQDPLYGEETTHYDLRQMEYYERLERLGCDEPLKVMQNN